MKPSAISITKHLKSPFVWIALLYFFTAKGHLEVIDTEYSVRTAEAIISHGSMRIEPVDEKVIEVSVNPSSDGSIYSQYGIGLAVLFIPFVTAGKIFASISGQSESMLIGFTLSFYNIPFALLGLLFARNILLKLGQSLRQANATIVIIAVGSAYWPYAVTDFSEVTQVAFLFGALNSMISKSHRKWRVFSLWFSLLVSIKLVYLLLLPIFIAFGMIEKRGDSHAQIKMILNASLFLVPLGLLIAYVNYIRFGSSLESGYGAHPNIGFGIDYFLEMAIPSLLSLNYGIMVFNPALLFFPTWRKLLQINRRFALLCLLLIGVWFSLMCSHTYGWGWGWGQRYLFAIIPVSMICLSFSGSWIKNRVSKTIFIVVIISSCLIQLVAVSTKFHEPLTMQIEAKSKFAGPYMPQLPSTFLLFAHKLLDGSTNYPLSIIGGNPDETVGLSDYESFRGFNFWPVHATKFLGFASAIRAVELLLLFIVLILQFGLLRLHLPNLIQRELG